MSNTPFPVGRRIEAPLGGVPPPNVFGVRRLAIRKGEEPMTCIQHAHSTTKGGLADLIASRIPPGQVINTLDRCQGVQGVVWRCQKTSKSRSRGTKIEVWRRLGASCRRLGASWGSRRVSWERLGRILGHLEGVLRTFWGVLGVSCMCLGGLLDPFCGHHGSVLGASCA